MTKPILSDVPRRGPAQDFLFLRHGETTWNKAKLTQGQLDAPLNATGWAQAAQAAEILAKWEIRRIVSSPLSRARETARTVARALGCPMETDDGLMECHLGAGQGRPHGPWLAAYWAGAETPAGGEPFEAFAARAWRAVVRLADRPGVLLVAHGGVWRAMMAYRRIEPAFWMPNGVPIHVRVSDDASQDGSWRAEPLAPLPAAPETVSGGPA